MMLDFKRINFGITLYILILSVLMHVLPNGKGDEGIKFGIYSFILSRERIGLFPSFTHCGFCVLFSWFFYSKETIRK